MLNNAKRRLSPGSLDNSVRRWPDSKTALHFPFLLILRLGKSKAPTMIHIAAPNMSGETQPDVARHTETLTDVACQLLLGNHDDALGYTAWYKYRG